MTIIQMLSITTADEFALQQPSSPNYQFWKNVHTEVQNAVDENIINIFV